MNHLKIENVSSVFQPESIDPYTLLQNSNFHIHPGEITSFLQFQGTGALVLMHILHENKKKELPGISLVTPALISPQEKELNVFSYLSGKQNNTSFSFPLFHKATSENKLRKILYGLQPGIENYLQKTIRELSTDEALLLTILPALLEQPEILLVDCISTLFPEALHSRLLNALQSFISQTNILLVFATGSPQLAFHLSDRIFVFNNDKLIQETDNSEKKDTTLQQLFQLYEESHFASGTSEETIRLITGQDI